MRAAQLVRPRSFRMVESSPPEPAPGQVLFRVTGCGVCGSNLPPWAGLDGVDYPLPPGSPGHEAWGLVEAVGTGVGLRPGDRVTTLSERSFGELDVAPADAVVRLPASLADREVPGEPVACAINVVRRAAVREGDAVVVLGVGFLGAVVLQLLHERAPRSVLAVSRRRTGHRFAEAAGADEVLGWNEVQGRVRALTGGAGADVVIECTGAQVPLDVGAELCRVRGRLVIAGYHQNGPRSVNMQLWNWRGLDVVNAHERDPAVYHRGMHEAVARMEDGRLDLSELLTHRYPLDDIEEAFRVAEQRPEGFLKAVVVQDA
jgi:threonine dehydrogenase-like Zn-dependent dehydrogenase